TASLREQLTTAQQQIRELSVRLRQYQADWAQLEAQLTDSQSDRAQTSRPPIPPLRRTNSEVMPFSPSRELTRSSRRIESLEHQLAQQATHYVRWQQTYQQIEEERNHLQTRVTTLEQQAAEMQEQILHQAQQATEYETAVQYWKDRYTTGQRQITHLRELVEQALMQPMGEHEGQGVMTADLLQSLLAALPNDTKEPVPGAVSPRSTTPELPDFLVRRRQKMREQGTLRG
ncbi:MAG TPA: hypothetical protein V6C65_00285, partial [Allocoleopsis sp.]